MSNIFLLLCFLYLKIVKLTNHTLSLSLSLECTSTEKRKSGRYPLPLSHTHTFLQKHTHTYALLTTRTHTTYLPTYRPPIYLSVPSELTKYILDYLFQFRFGRLTLQSNLTQDKTFEVLILNIYKKVFLRKPSQYLFTCEVKQHMYYTSGPRLKAITAVKKYSKSETLRRVLLYDRNSFKHRFPI